MSYSRSSTLGDLNSYYHIYEISTEDFSGAVNFANDLSKDAQESLKQLRFLFTLNCRWRGSSLLIDLLTLRPKSNVERCPVLAPGVADTPDNDRRYELKAPAHLLDALKVEDQHDSDLASGSQDADSIPRLNGCPCVAIPTTKSGADSKIRVNFKRRSLT